MNKKETLNIFKEKVSTLKKHLNRFPLHVYFALIFLHALAFMFRCRLFRSKLTIGMKQEEKDEM